MSEHEELQLKFRPKRRNQQRNLYRSSKGDKKEEYRKV